MRLKNLLGCGVAAVSLTVAAAPADAAVINLIDNGFAGTAQQQQQFRIGFKIAALYWGSILSNPVTVNLRVGTAALGTGIIGSTGSARADYSVANWESRVNATKSNSAIDTAIVLPTLTSGGASFITNGVTNNVDDTTKLRYDNATTVSSKILYLNSSVIKAIGGSAAGVTSSSVDGTVQFSTNFGFDFNPTDGLDVNTFDFIGVAIHEIGHALGFVSGVDFLDVYGLGNTNNPNAGALGYSLNDTSIYSSLDMFRYSADPTNLVPGGAALDLSAGTVSGAKYFSIDGGATALFGNTFAQGSYNGDGSQASHWKDTPNCQIGNGIMDPTFCYQQMGYITGLDLAAFDAMGWNLSVNALTYTTRSTGSIYREFAAAAAAPEPATWGLMVIGFGLIGGGMRRRSTKVSFAA